MRGVVGRHQRRRVGNDDGVVVHVEKWWATGLDSWLDCAEPRVNLMRNY
jgi:hypothetical protein